MSTVLRWGAVDSENDQSIISEPTEINIEGRVQAISAGIGHTLILTDTSLVYSYGNNDHGQLGREQTNSELELVSSLSAKLISQVSAGAYHNVALTSAGQMFSWGSNYIGQLGLGTQSSDPCPVPSLVKTLATRTVIQVACGDQHSLALTNESRLYTWGSNDHGQLGFSESLPFINIPTCMESIGGLPIRFIAAGGSHNFLLTCSGGLFSWGKNTYGQLGLNDTTGRYFPTLCKSLKYQRIKFISCGENHTAVLTDGGGVFTFGQGRCGQLGHNSLNDEVLPKCIMELMGSTILQVACGRQHTIVLESYRGSILAFGLASSGQLGTGATEKRIIPTQIKGKFEPFASFSKKTDSYVVRSIHCGGHQSFSVCSKSSKDREILKPLDFREYSHKFQVATLSKDMAIAIHALNSDTRIPSDIADKIELVFGSLGCLNASFLTPNDGHFGCGKNNHGLHMESAQMFFDLIKESRNTIAVLLITHHLEDRLLPQLEASHIPDVEALRAFIILPLCHLFHYKAHFSKIMLPFAKSVINLNAAASTILAFWWSKMKPSYIINIITIYKNCLIENLHKKIVNEKKEFTVQAHSVFVCLELLKRLHMMNELSNQLVSYNKFYIDNISDLIEIQADYVNWLQRSNSEIHSSYVFSFCDYPFLFNGATKTLLLQTDALIQMQNAVNEVSFRNFTGMFTASDPVCPFLILSVSRKNILQDTISQLYRYDCRDLKKPLKVLFENEEAMDAGGLKKEFFLLLIREVLDPQYGMFIYYEESRLLWFSHRAFEDNSMFNLIGILCGLAIYNSIIIDLPFPLALFKKFLKREITLDDLKELQPAVGSGIQKLLDYEEDDIADAIGVTFSVTEEHFGEVVTVDLRDGGSNVAVTQANKDEYVKCYLDYVFNTSISNQYEAFASGFHKVCSFKVMELFQPIELQEMVIGNEDYDWDEFDKSTEYKGVFYRKHPTIEMFWKVFRDLSLAQKKKFLLFLTGSDRVPISGMKSLKMVIQHVGGGDKYHPVAHTCFNLLDLPAYSTIAILRERLLVAIEHTQGFTLV